MYILELLNIFIVLDAQSWHSCSLSPLWASKNIDEIKQKPGKTSASFGMSCWATHCLSH